jgi:drug/metabolite transporter (DMT)-like permease
MLMGVSLAWGLTWPALRIALEEIPPFSMRVGTSAIGALALVAFAPLTGRDLRVRGLRARAHLVVAGCLNVTAFALLSAYAQLVTSTSRVSVLTYSMPVWAALIAYPVLGERPNRTHAAALVMCVAGLAILIYPLTDAPDLMGIALALTSAMCWGAGTVYLKWARIDADPLAISAWQVVVTLVIVTPGAFLVEGSLHLWPVPARSLLALVFAALLGSAFAYLLWFDVVRRLPATTAALGILSVPVVGVVASVLVLGERPSAFDVIGFALILTAAGCVVLAPSVRPTERT